MSDWSWPSHADDGTITSSAARYRLPELLEPGTAPSVGAWERGRARVLEALSSSVYGFTPDGGGLAELTLVAERGILGGSATRSEWIMTVSGPRGAMDVPLLVFQPTQPARAGGAGVFLGMNIVGNHAVEALPGARLGTSWMPVAWPIRTILARGYALVTLLNDSVEPDIAGGAWCGVRSLFQPGEELEEQAPTQWGALGAWAWALSRTREAIEQMAGLDAARVVVHGHSRLGMTALWAAAQDERFAGAISSESGLGGASLTRHVEGETVAFITRHFPYWFCGNYAAFADRDTEVPVDQHQLLALIAPRPLHVSSASLDRHADPEGEFLATLHASPVYELYGRRGTLPAGFPRAGFDLSPQEAAAVPLPSLRERYGGTLSYHVRWGAHGVTPFDWDQFLDFADRNGI